MISITKVPTSLHGLGDWMSDLFGKSQSWYDRVGRDQRDISILAAEVYAIGKAAWDELQLRLADAIAQGYQMPVERFPNFQWIVDDLDEQSSILTLTTRRFSTSKPYPTDAEISTAENRIATYRAAVDYARSILPELAPALDEEVARVSGALPEGSLQSPARVGMETFKAELARREIPSDAAPASTGTGVIPDADEPAPTKRR